MGPADPVSWMVGTRPCRPYPRRRGGAAFDGPRLLSTVAVHCEQLGRASRGTERSERAMGPSHEAGKSSASDRALEIDRRADQRAPSVARPHATDPVVIWAGSDPAPMWLRVAREYTERWHHQQQIREALGRAFLTEPQWFAPRAGDVRPCASTYLRRRRRL